MLKERKPPATDWDYRTANTKEYTHGIHPYPAMMIPQVARRLIQTYGKDGGTLFDPYCGTGTTLLEGMLADMESAGTDLNPLARLIAKVKTTPIDLESVDDAIENFVDFGLEVAYADTIRVSLPKIPNIDYWFSERAQCHLALTLGYIRGIACERTADFFKVAFSLTARKVSWTKNSEFKLVRMPRERMESHNPDVFSVMYEILSSNREAFASLRETLDDEPRIPAVHDFNTVTEMPQYILPSESIDMVVTSPPYGDSRTTVAYGQFSRLSSQWLGYEEANRVDNALMGGSRLVKSVSFGVKELDDVIGEIASVDGKRANEVASFFVDYRDSIKNVASAMKPGGYACYVVGNRRVKGFEVPTAEATAAFFESNGFSHVDTFSRNIPNKRMPSMNSPTNIPGRLGKTMKAEKIVICRRDA